MQNPKEVPAGWREMTAGDLAARKTDTDAVKPATDTQQLIAVLSDIERRLWSRVAQIDCVGNRMWGVPPPAPSPECVTDKASEPDTQLERIGLITRNICDGLNRLDSVAERFERLA